MTNSIEEVARAIVVAHAARKLSDALLKQLGIPTTGPVDDDQWEKLRMLSHLMAYGAGKKTLSKIANA